MLIENSWGRHLSGETYGNGDFPKISARLGKLAAIKLRANRAPWHRTCYSETCHSGHLERARVRYVKACQQRESQQIQKRRGRPSSINSAQSVQVSSEPCQKDTRFTRSMAAPFKKEMCFFSKRTHLVKISMKFPPLMQLSNSEMWWERATMKHGELILVQTLVQMMPVPLISSTTYHAG